MVAHPEGPMAAESLDLLASALSVLRAADDPTMLARRVAAMLCETVGLACRIDLLDDGVPHTVARHPAEGDILRGGEGGVTWASVPLATAGRRVGELCLALAPASVVGPNELAALESIGAALAVALASADAHRQTTQISNRLQRSLLPSALPAASWFEVAASYLPATAGLYVGGDWYDAQLLSDSQLALSVGDVAGHGVEAAARMGEIRSAITALRLASGAPDDLVGHLHRVCDEPSSFATALCGRITRDGEFRWSSAGHLPPVLASVSGGVELLRGRQSPPLGVGANGSVPLNQRPLAVGDTVLLFTDGLVEQRDEALDRSLERLLTDVAAAPSLQPFQLVEHLVSGRQASGPTRDDIALLAARLVTPA